MQPNQTITQPNGSLPQAPKSNKKLVLALGVVLILAAGAASYLVLASLNSKNKEIDDQKYQISALNDKLEQAEARIAELDDPQKKINDAQRKTDMAKVSSIILDFVASNNGRFPTTEPSVFRTEFVGAYDSELSTLVDPNTKLAYTFTPVAKVQTPPGLVLGDIQYQHPGVCNGSEFGDNATVRQAAIRTLLQTGETYCINI